MAASTPQGKRKLPAEGEGLATEDVEDVAAWLLKNQSQIQQAERVLSDRWADLSLFNERMEVCKEVLPMMKKVLGGEETESKSLLLLGEQGSGKTQAVEWCLQRLKEEKSDLLTLRARGDTYISNAECLRHLASQIAAQLLSAPKPSACFEVTMEWFRCILKESCSRSSAVVIVLDRFEFFCGLARQTLLYNLFNIAQELSVRLCIVGISEEFDVVSKLEKRLFSRFSGQSVYALVPTCATQLLKLLECKLHLPENCPGLDETFVEEFNHKMSLALSERMTDWKELAARRRPTWFLWRCLPVASFLRAALTPCPEVGEACETPPKRPRPGPAGPGALCSVRPGGPLKSLLDFTDSEWRTPLLSGLTEGEHLVLLTLFRQLVRDPREPRSLSKVLFELEQLVGLTGVLVGHTTASLTASFAHLLEVKLVEFSSRRVSEEVPKVFRPCTSNVDGIYRQWVADLPKGELSENPLRRFPEEVRLWVLKQATGS